MTISWLTFYIWASISIKNRDIKESILFPFCVGDRHMSHWPFVYIRLFTNITQLWCITRCSCQFCCFCLSTAATICNFHLLQYADEEGVVAKCLRKKRRRRALSAFETQQLYHWQCLRSNTIIFRLILFYFIRSEHAASRNVGNPIA